MYNTSVPEPPGFLFVGNNNAVWDAAGDAGTDGTGFEMAVSGCTGTVGDRHGDPSNRDGDGRAGNSHPPCAPHPCFA